MRSCDVLVTKPSELSFYPVPKLFIRRVGGHEQWGAIHSAEIGDGTLACRDIPHTLQMMKLFLEEKTLLCDMCDNIVKNKEAGIYDGAYKVVELAFSMKQKKFSEGKKSSARQRTRIFLRKTREENPLLARGLAFFSEKQGRKILCSSEDSHFSPKNKEDL